MTFSGPDHAPVAVICAMENELTHLRTMFPQTYEDWYTERYSWVTSLENHSIILCCCGVGMSNAAATTEAVINRYHPTAILNYGCSGSHRLDLLPGDLVIGSRLVTPDRVVLEADGSERYIGMWYLHHGIHKKVQYLSCSPELLELATQTATILEGTHEPWPLDSRWPSSVPHRSPQVFIGGTIATSESWNRAVDRISHLVAQHDSVCEDMEAAAIALICASHDVPFLAVKDISNNELLQTTNDQHFQTTTAEQVGKRAAAFIFTMLRNYFLS
jgi:adenosylhomocysteine nucleosidase